MRKILIVIGFIVFLFSCNQEEKYYRTNQSDFEPDLRITGNGIPKMMTITTYDSTTGKNQIGGEESKIEYKFDKDGNVISSEGLKGDILSLSSEFKSYKYENGLSISEEDHSVMTNRAPDLFKFKELISRKNNQDVWINGYKDLTTKMPLANTPIDTTFISYSKDTIYYKHNKGGVLSAQIWVLFNDKGDTKSIRSRMADNNELTLNYVYDDAGLITKISMETDYPEIKEGKTITTVSYEYPEFDDLKNWTKRITIHSDSSYSLTTRMISYW